MKLSQETDDSGRGASHVPLTCTITRASVDDAAEILELQKTAYQSEAILYNDWSIPPLTQTLPEIRAEFASSLFLKAVHETRIIGSVRALLDSGVCHIGRLIVHPDCQRRGIGSSLMRSMVASFPGAQCFRLFTGTKSVGSIRLYRKLGYRECGEQELSEKVRIVFMEKLQENAARDS